MYITPGAFHKLTPGSQDMLTAWIQEHGQRKDDIFYIEVHDGSGTVDFHVYRRNLKSRHYVGIKKTGLASKVNTVQLKRPLPDQVKRELERINV